jgi:hypothetical protein
LSTFARSGKFSKKIILVAWERQGGQCAKCGDKLTKGNQNQGEVGVWHAHPRFLGLGYKFEDNCVLLCTDPPKNCHWNIGHASFHQRFYGPLEDCDLPYFYAGTRHKHPSSEFKEALNDLRNSPGHPDR